MKAINETWYRGRWGDITKVVVIGETDKFIILAETPNCKTAKMSTWEIYDRDYSKVYEYLKVKLQREVDGAMGQLEYKQRNLDKFLKNNLAPGVTNE